MREFISNFVDVVVMLCCSGVVFVCLIGAVRMLFSKNNHVEPWERK